MLRKAVLAAAGLLLVVTGWLVGRAQAAPDFEFVIDAPAGDTHIDCVRGCKLAWVERGMGGSPQTTFRFSCHGQVERCSSGRIGGWLNQ